MAENTRTRAATLQLVMEQVIACSIRVDAAANLLGCTEESVAAAVRAGAVCGIRDQEDVLWLPARQFRDAKPLPGLLEVIAALDRPGPLARAVWLTRPNKALAMRSPIEALRDGDLDLVVSEARGVQAAAG